MKDNQRLVNEMSQWRPFEQATSKPVGHSAINRFTALDRSDGEGGNLVVYVVRFLDMTRWSVGESSIDSGEERKQSGHAQAGRIRGEVVLRDDVVREV